MFRGRTVAVVVPALDEEGTIAAVVREYRAQSAVDRVIVVDNASRDRTAERALAAGAELVREERPGYGAALRAGLEHACETGAGWIVLTEADGSFAASEIVRLLEPLGAHPLVLGSRTSSMGGPAYLRVGNRSLARFLARLWSRTSPSLTDVGCTYRALSSEAWRSLRDGVRSDGPEFSPEMICEACALGLATIEVPVRYGGRAAGVSRHTGSFQASARTALRMLATILAKRLARPRRERARPG